MYLESLNLDHLNTFKTDQIKEENEKLIFIQTRSEIKGSIYKLEDSDFLRGCISIFDLDSNLEQRANNFLKFFDEGDFSKEFNTRSNVLLSFGDYSQSDGSFWHNLMSSNATVIRKFFTTPGYGKNKDIYSKTKPVLYECLDYLNNNTTSYNQIIEKYITDSESNGRDWKYYFIKYPSFRTNCNKGFYYWFSANDDFHFNKMKEKQFNGYNWCPFLYEVNSQISSKHVSLENYNNFLEVFRHKSRIGIQFFQDSIKINNLNKDERENWMIEILIKQDTINEDGDINILQNKDSLDIEDRIEKMHVLVNKILELKKIE
jgi:hypothetical protein